MKRKTALRITLIVLLLVAIALIGSFSCRTTATIPTPSPSPTAPEILSPVPTAKPTIPISPKPATPPPTPSQPAVIKWNMQSSDQLNHPHTKFMATEWAEWVKSKTGGRLQIEVHPAGTFAPATDLMPAVGRGLVQASLDYAGFYTQTVPVANIETGLPLAWDRFILPFDAFYNRGLFDLLREAYAEYNVLPLAAKTSNTYYNLETKFPFNSLDDIKGRKIRALGIYADYVKALGGQPVVLPLGEMYMGLKTGIVDGLIAGVYALKTYKIAEIVTHFVAEPSLSPAASTAPHVNMDAFKKLPEDIRKILEEDTRHFMQTAMLKMAVDELVAKAWAEKEYGVKFVKLSPQDEEKARNIAMSIWDEVAKKDARSAKAVAIVKQQLKDYGILK